MHMIEKHCNNIQFCFYSLLSYSMHSFGSELLRKVCLNQHDIVNKVYLAVGNVNCVMIFAVHNYTGNEDTSNSWQL